MRALISAYHKYGCIDIITQGASKGAIQGQNGLPFPEPGIGRPASKEGFGVFFRRFLVGSLNGKWPLLMGEKPAYFELYGLRIGIRHGLNYIEGGWRG